MDDKEHKRIPTLSRDNHELWFQDIKFQLEGKDIFYVIETSKLEYAWIRRSTSSLPIPSVRTPSVDTDDVDHLTSQFEQLGGTWNTEKLKEYKRDQAKAFSIISGSLTDEDKSAIGEHDEVKEFWSYLKTKYGKTNQSTAHHYMTKLQTFHFESEKGLDSAWTELKGYRRKLIAANNMLCATYPDEALFLILTRALPAEYKPITRGFITQPNLTVDEKIKMLGEQEEELKEEQESAHVAQRKPSRFRRHRSSSPESASERGTGCHLCKGQHYLRHCPDLSLAKKLLRRHHRDKKAKKHEKSSKDSKALVPAKKSHGFAAAGDDSSAGSGVVDISSSDPDSDSDAVETCHLSKDEISKATPHSWASDTAASSHMSDQPSIFRHMIPIKRRKILVGGGEIYSDHRGVAELTCADGSSMLLKDVLFVPGLGVNLLSARRLCQAGLKGSLDSNTMVFKLGKKRIVTATMTNGLYVVSHVSRGYREVAFPSAEVDMPDQPTLVVPVQQPSVEPAQQTHQASQTDKDR